ncbi:MAG: recombination protein RecR [Candidatus Pacebacteria bacterium]|nr:recombination protein RecR [Candidatus Paceibacterota bacterium]
MNSIDKLTEYFIKFPGIGPRQAKRFVYFLLTRDSAFLNELANTLKSLKSDSKMCQSCSRFYSSSNYNSALCDICLNKNRDTDTLMIVAKDADLTNIERIGNYNGSYFVLGGFISILEKNPEQKVRITKLLSLIQTKIKNSNLKEVILALSLNPDGENTLNYISEKLKPILENQNIKITTLGRGLSTGTELEYLDDNTFQNAFKNRG